MFTTRFLQAARQIMKVHPVKALEDNYMYLVCDKNNKGFVVDPVEPDKIQEVADKLKIKIEAALVTHHHYDHAGGMIEFNKIHPEAPIYGGDDRIDKLTNKVETGSKFNVGEMIVNCYSTPCHTRGHICFFVTSDDNDPVVFTGDTLFIAGCGKFFEGTAEEMDKNLNETLANLPGETQVYCGHEYTTSNLKFAHHIEPGNQAVKERLKHSMELEKSHTPTVPSTIAEEKEINPFMRVHSEEIKKNVGATDPVEVMKRLREAKNSYKAIRMSNNAEDDIAIAQGAVLVKSCEIPAGAIPIRGYDFNQGIDFSALMKSYLSTGFQATHLAKAIQQINSMLDEREHALPENDDLNSFFPYPEERKKKACTIFLGYTSNLVSSGIRETIRFIAQHNLVDCIVTSAGGIEEDLIKCLRPSYLGAFDMDGKKLRSQGMNRAGNILIPNDNYCSFEDWLNPILDVCLQEQEKGFSWTPSKLIHRLGAEIKNEDSILYWAAYHNIPVFCPALTDGSLGDMLYFHSVAKAPGIKLDIVEDVRHINTLSVKSIRTGVIILGGGVVKHHINNANLMRNGSDYTVYINTGQEFDGSDSGAQPDEAVSWGKIKPGVEAVKVHAEATLVFPLIVAETFAKRVHRSL